MQERIKTYLQGLKFSQFTRDGVSPNDALISLVSVIKRNYVKTPHSWQCEDNNMSILEDAVSGMPWARSPIDRLHSDIKSFEEFYGALSNILQKYVKESRATPASGNEIYFQQPHYASRSPNTSQQFNNGRQGYNHGNGNSHRFHKKWT